MIKDIADGNSPYSNIELVEVKDLNHKSGMVALLKIGGVLSDDYVIRQGAF